MPVLQVAIMSRSLNILKKALVAMKSSKGFEKVYQTLEVVKASEGQCTLQWKVDENLLNDGGTLHGGAICSIVDNATTMALYTTPRGVRGVSLELSVSFLGPARPGDLLTIEALCKKVGKTIGFTEASIINQQGRLIATGKHTKFLGSAMSSAEEEKS